MLYARVAKLRSGKAWSEEPPSRTRRFITNVEIELGNAPGELRARSNFLVHRSRHALNVEFHVGGRLDVLRRVEDGFRIVERTLTLNAGVLDAPNLAVFL